MPLGYAVDNVPAPAVDTKTPNLEMEDNNEAFATPRGYARESGLTSPFPDLEGLRSVYGDHPFANMMFQHASDFPDLMCVTWLDGSGEKVTELTFGQVKDKVLNMCAYFKADLALEAGDRVILCYTPGLDFITAFLGCVVSGIVAVPVYPPDPNKLSTDIPRLCDIAQSSQAKFVLTNQ
ncbi:unnamed protein product [Vitrella brassicaformis CCMP3155]|uniref:AMP-dependent synthetase/ligase domain-containing protein n=1 Tax=Vitrella brassicaformis (strain CCMP3155) TaxID=1169540 RepID=A0A0G4EJ61_VITBC|nr:unnamed protein product [Vitrella brassicaformis CCMP3155]|eukprot:CEL96743.1 unnamed protein product [Vitrella brassicaformis CCMP3155]